MGACGAGMGGRGGRWRYHRGRRVERPGLQGGALGWVVGACGAGAAGSEIQPYLEGGIEEAALFGGGTGGGEPALP